MNRVDDMVLLVATLNRALFLTSFGIIMPHNCLSFSNTGGDYKRLKVDKFMSSRFCLYLIDQESTWAWHSLVDQKKVHHNPPHRASSGLLTSICEKRRGEERDRLRGIMAVILQKFDSIFHGESAHFAGQKHMDSLCAKIPRSLS